jgi:hypothetical protein
MATDQHGDRRDRLDAAYRATIFRIEAESGSIDIRIGASHPAVDALLACFGASAWTFVSACNPASRIVSLRDNSQRHARLRAELTAASRSFLEGCGFAAAPWPPEPSLWIPGIGRDAAAELGHRHGQNAIVCGTLEGPAELVWLR